MATKIRIKRGTESQITGYTGTQYEGELAYATNTGEVFVNNGTQFISVSGSSETPTLQSVTDAGAITTNDITTGSITSNGNFLITGTGSTVQLRGSSVDFDIQTTAADNVARIATTTGGSGRLELYNHISGFNGALEFRATSWENDALVISGGTPNTTKFLVSRDPNAATLQVTGESYFTGNVGIGTTAPTEKLEVVGKAIIRKSGTAAPHGDTDFLVTDATAALSTAQMQILGGNNASSILYFSDTDAYNVGGIKYEHSDNSMRLQVNSGEKVIITDTGNVGIGTAAPLAKLHIKDGNTLTTALPNTSALIEGFSQSILQVASHSTGYSQLAFGDQDDGFDGGLFYSNASRYLAIEAANAEQMRFTSDGKVGIGTTSPAAKLHVAGEIRVNAGQPVMFDVANNIYAVAAQNQFRLYSGGNPAISITTAGRIGIGTTAPTEKLHITGGGAGNIRLDAGGTYYGTNIQAISSAGLKIGNDDFSGYAFFADDGNVGIGTTAPTNLLHIVDATDPTFKIGDASNRNITLRGGTSSRTPNISSYSGLGLGGSDGAFHAFINNAGSVGIGTTVPNSKVHISGTAMQQLRMETAGGPSSSGDTSGRIGDMAYDDDFFYIKTANGWGRVQLDFGF